MNNVQGEDVMKKYKTIACDFDGTLCEFDFPNIGKPKVEVVNFIKKAHKAGHHIIIWTCRTGEYVQDMIRFLKKWGIPYDKINENYKIEIDDCRKVFADIYLDDRALNVDDLEGFDLDTMSFKNDELEGDMEYLFKLITDNIMYMEEFDTSKLEKIMDKFGFRLTEDLLLEKVEEQDE
jgi:hydroxymethylpyrimidine pyrophosphatase-like HAD family hydrolase